MKEVDWLKSLDRDQPAPAVDVAGSVMRAIRTSDEPVTESFGWAAILATLAGGGTVALALQMWFAFADPLGGFLDTFKLVLQ